MSLRRASIVGLALIALWTALASGDAAAKCSGRFLNPVSDICWRCVFPLRLSGVKIFGKDQDDNDSSSNTKLICNCGPKWVGLPVGYFEPHYMVDVTTDPYCTPSLGGKVIGNVGLPGDAQGTVAMKPGNPGRNSSFYHYVLYKNPILVLMGAFSDNPCLDQSVFDVLQFSAVNPTWANDQLATILSPDAFLYGGLGAILTGIPVGVCATVGGDNGACLALRRMAHWTVGFNGQTYPLTGANSNDLSSVSTAHAIMKRALTLGHRTLTIWGTSGSRGMCGYYAEPFFDTTDIKVQMTFPSAETAGWFGSGGAANAADFDKFTAAIGEAAQRSGDASSGPPNLTSLSGTEGAGRCCHALEASTLPWSLGRTWAFSGEDMSFMVFQKRDCCMAGGSIASAINP